MESVANSDELQCVLCGTLRSLDDSDFKFDKKTEFETSARKGSYIPLRHATGWLDDILAISIPKIEPARLAELVEKVKVWIKQRPAIMVPNVRQIRAALKEIGGQKAYKYSTYFIANCSNFVVPRLSEEERETICHKVSVILLIFDQFSEPGRNNTHYPYIIYKIIEDTLPDSERKNTILSLIYMQGEATIENHDNNWRQHCGAVGIKYRPTSLNVNTNTVAVITPPNILNRRTMATRIS